MSRPDGGVDRVKCKGCEEWFDEDEMLDEDFCCEECEQYYENPRLLK